MSLGYAVKLQQAQVQKATQISRFKGLYMRLSEAYYHAFGSEKQCAM